VISKNSRLSISVNCSCGSPINCPSAKSAPVLIIWVRIEEFSTRSASYAQVTEKLYTRSVFRYKNYEKNIQEIIPILEPAIKTLGYEI